MGNARSTAPLLPALGAVGRLLVVGGLGVLLLFSCILDPFGPSAADGEGSRSDAVLPMDGSGAGERDPLPSDSGEAPPDRDDTPDLPDGHQAERGPDQVATCVAKHCSGLAPDLEEECLLMCASTGGTWGGPAATQYARCLATTCEGLSGRQLQLCDAACRDKYGLHPANVERMIESCFDRICRRHTQPRVAASCRLGCKVPLAEWACSQQRCDKLASGDKRLCQITCREHAKRTGGAPVKGNGLLVVCRDSSCQDWSPATRQECLSRCERIFGS